MLSKADNELLTRTGPGTVMGNLYRRFWAPVMLESELGGPDSPPVRVNVLGEKLIAFRDTGGKVGLLEAYCPHRRANLFWGRNEEHGLRCAYHGWKFDVTGQCVDLPNCPEGENLKAKVRTAAYPVLVRCGIVWAYLGPEDRVPPFPENEVFHVDAASRHVIKVHLRANMAQVQEGDVDSSHVAFLHSTIDGTQLAASRANPNTFADKSPRWFTAETEYGLMLSAQRNAGPDSFQWRVNQWLMPFCTLVASMPGKPIHAQLRVPIDDESSYLFRLVASLERPLTTEERAVYTGGVMFPELLPGTDEPVENMDNDYLIDRSDQRTHTYSGIKSFVAQDLAITEDQRGPLANRADELLTSSDRAIIALRKRLLTSAKQLAAGIEPPEAGNAGAYRVRPGDFLLPRETEVADGAKDILLIGAR